MWVTRVATVAAVGALLVPALPAAEVDAAPNRTVGIWYSSWYRNKGHLVWQRGHGHGSTQQLLGDVNGDGRADAVAYFGADGAWWVAGSNGQTFGPPSRWIAGHGIGSSRQFLADVDRDGKADAVVFFAHDGAWYVARSTGSGFQPYYRWNPGFGHGVGSDRQFVADVNGDGWNDAVVFFRDGAWYVALGSAGGLAPWLRANPAFGHGVGSTDQMMDDVDGDGRADAIVWFASTGDWFVSRGRPDGRVEAWTRWIQGHGVGSSRRMLGDTDGDGKADAVVYFDGTPTKGSTWYRARSNGASFSAGDALAPWKRNLGHAFRLYTWDYARRAPGPMRETPTLIDLADVDGNLRTAEPVVASRDGGIWKVLPEPYSEPKWLNSWEENDVGHRPLVNGVAQQYDSSDIAVMDAHIRQIDAAGIDYILFDLTNGLGTDGIGLNVLAMCQRIVEFNKRGGHLEFAIAIGNHASPEALENETGLALMYFASGWSPCASAYFKWEGKPFVVSFDAFATRAAWEQPLSPKPYTSLATLRWSQGALPDGNGEFYDYPSRTGWGCYMANAIGKPPPSLYGEYVPWGLPYGSLGAGPIMGVTPGWNTRANGGWYIKRSQFGIEGAFYTRCGWDRVVNAKPRMVVIASFNEFVEENAVEPADTTQNPAVSHRWSKPDVYWNLTVEGIRRYRAA